MPKQDMLHFQLFDKSTCQINNKIEFVIRLCLRFIVAGMANTNYSVFWSHFARDSNWHPNELYPIIHPTLLCVHTYIHNGGCKIPVSVTQRL